MSTVTDLRIPRNGPARAAARAHSRGLTVGRSVAAQCRGWQGIGDPSTSRHFVPYGERTYAGSGGAEPLEFGERLSNYRLQVAVRDHHVTGSKWRPTPRQRRRLEHKARAAQVRRLLAMGPREAGLERVTNLATGEQRTEPLAAPVTPQEFAREYVVEPRQQGKAERGFRIVDRRGEHR